MSLEGIFKAAAGRVDVGAGYAGDATPEETWEILTADPNAVLVDVRTQPEWAFVGVPDLGSIDKQPLFVSWQIFPAMDVNTAFADELIARGVIPDRTVLFLCRSGVRSAASAKAMTVRGVARALNILGGFEGPHDARKQRGTVDGWKARGLPWIQG